MRQKLIHLWLTAVESFYIVPCSIELDEFLRQRQLKSFFVQALGGIQYALAGLAAGVVANGYEVVELGIGKFNRSLAPQDFGGVIANQAGDVFRH